MKKVITIKPVGKYVNKCGEEGIRYIWKIDNKDDYYVESGSFLRRTKLGEGTKDESIKAYTTSVSLGCILSQKDDQCKFCVTGNTIPFTRLLSSREIALQNIFMMLDDEVGDLSKNKREFAYMGQGEPSFSYKEVKEAIVGTDIIVKKLESKTYRHIFATCGNPYIIKKLSSDFKRGYFGDTKILLHLSIHSVNSRNQIMPINKRYPLKDVILSSEIFSKVSEEKVVINFLMFKEAILSKSGPLTTASKEEINNLIKLLNPKYHRIILCEYNPSNLIGINKFIEEKKVEEFEKIIKEAGFEVKKFISFGKEDRLACGLLGGKGSPNLDEDKIRFNLDRAIKLVNENVKDF
ncbi:MAG: hypothetical protein KJ674_05565 [Nanoarchaeota archaeon]|nr:hypothetical protein [Nanoarchaeota archaeon]